MADWWTRVDLTLSGYIGGDEHPNKPPLLKENINNSPLYNSLVKKKYSNMIRILKTSCLSSYFYSLFLGEANKLKEDCRNGYYKYFGEYRNRCEQLFSGNQCDRCGVNLNFLSAEIMESVLFNKRWGSGLCIDCSISINTKQTKFFK